MLWNFMKGTTVLVHEGPAHHSLFVALADVSNEGPDNLIRKTARMKHCFCASAPAPMNASCPMMGGTALDYAQKQLGEQVTTADAPSGSPHLELIEEQSGIGCTVIAEVDQPASREVDGVLLSQACDGEVPDHIGSSCATRPRLSIFTTHVTCTLWPSRRYSS